MTTWRNLTDCMRATCNMQQVYPGQQITRVQQPHIRTLCNRTACLATAPMIVPYKSLPVTHTALYWKLHTAHCKLVLQPYPYWFSTSIYHAILVQNFLISNGWSPQSCWGLQQIKMYSSGTCGASGAGDPTGPPAFVFDIDGVLIRGSTVLPSARCSDMP